MGELRKEGQPELYNPSKPFNDQIRSLIRSTHPTSGPITVAPAGKRFEVERDPDFVGLMREQECTDGIGTKGLLHWKMNTVADGAQDVFAMVVDDLIEGGYVPFKLQDHVMIQEENTERIFSIISGLVRLAKENSWEYPGNAPTPIAITGGETAVINTLQGFEMDITATGYVRKGGEIVANARPGDAIIGIESSGIHSNGLTFMRDELLDKRGMRLDTELPWGRTVGDELTIPTNVYLPAIKALIKDVGRNIHGMVHITGGGLSKLRELVPNKDADIALYRDEGLEPQEIFRYAHDELGVSPEKMYARFNNGIGYVVAVDRNALSTSINSLGRYFTAAKIGEVLNGKGIISIESEYDASVVRYG